MPLSFANRSALQWLIMALALVLIAGCFVAGNRVARTADLSRQDQAQHDAQHASNALLAWVDAHHYALVGMAALFNGASDITEEDFQRAIVSQPLPANDSTIPPVYWLTKPASGGPMQVRYRADSGSPQLAGYDPAVEPGIKPLLAKLASGQWGREISSSLFQDDLGHWHAWLALSAGHGKDAGVLVTRMDFGQPDVISGAIAPGLALRMAIQTQGAAPVYVTGSATADPGARFSVPIITSRYGIVWHMYWDVLPNYGLNAAWQQSWELANLLRYGGSLVTLLAAWAIWMMLGLVGRIRLHAATLSRTHARLQESEQHYRSLIEQIPGAVFRGSVDTSRSMAFVSSGITLLSGWTPAELEGKPDSGNLLIHPGDRELLITRARHALRTGQRYDAEYRLLQKDGESRWVYERGTAYPGPHGEPVLDGVIIDIHARKMAEAAVLKQAATMRTIIDNAPHIAIQGYDINGNTLFWNHASERFFGWTEADVVGRQPERFTRSADGGARFLELLAEVAQSGRPSGLIEWHCHCLDGRTLWCQSAITPVGELNGVDAFICMDVDITDHKQAEDDLRHAGLQLEEKVTARTQALQEANEDLKRLMDQLVQAEKLASLGSLVAGIAHELNTPLGNTVTVASTLSQKVAEFSTELANGPIRKSALDGFIDTCSEAANLIENNVVRAADLVTHFKQVAVDTASTRRRMFDLQQTVNDVLSTLGPQIKHTPHQIETDIAPRLLLESYPGPLERIIGNLITNSLLHGFANEAHGLIRITARHLDIDTVSLVFEDNGCGIPAALRKRVFDPFFTTRLGQGGSGLGLYIVYSLVTALLGGSLTLGQSSLGGVRFEIIIPRVAPIPATPEADDAQ